MGIADKIIDAINKSLDNDPSAKDLSELANAAKAAQDAKAALWKTPALSEETIAAFKREVKLPEEHHAHADVVLHDTLDEAADKITDKIRHEIVGHTVILVDDRAIDALHTFARVSEELLRIKTWLAASEIDQPKTASDPGTLLLGVGAAVNAGLSAFRLVRGLFGKDVSFGTTKASATSNALRVSVLHQLIDSAQGAKAIDLTVPSFRSVSPLLNLVDEIEQLLRQRPKDEESHDEIKRIEEFLNSLATLNEAGTVPLNDLLAVERGFEALQESSGNQEVFMLRIALEASSATTAKFGNRIFIDAAVVISYELFDAEGDLVDADVLRWPTTPDSKEIHQGN